MRCYKYIRVHKKNGDNDESYEVDNFIHVDVKYRKQSTILLICLFVCMFVCLLVGWLLGCCWCCCCCCCCCCCFKKNIIGPTYESFYFFQKLCNRDFKICIISLILQKCTYGYINAGGCLPIFFDDFLLSNALCYDNSKLVHITKKEKKNDDNEKEKR